MKTMPPPDPSTRADVDFVPDALTSPRLRGRRAGELIVAAGLGGILVAVCSAFAKLLDLPSLSEMAVAGLGVVLVLVGGFKAYSARALDADAACGNRPRTVDLCRPSLLDG